MYVLNVPYVPKTEAWGVSRGPDIPDGVDFASASDALDGQGRALIYLPHGTPAIVQACIDRGGLLVRDSNTADQAETEAMVTALRTADPRWLTSVKPLHDQRANIRRTAGRTPRPLTPGERDTIKSLRQQIADLESVYIDDRFRAPKAALVARAHDPCLPYEQARDAQRALAKAKQIVVGVGLIAAVAFLMHTFGMPAAWALTVLHADTFNRSDSAIHGSTMSDTLGTWVSSSTSYPTVKSNQVASDTGDWRYCYDSAASAVDVQRTSMSYVTALIQATVRTGASTGGYASDARNAASYLYEFDGTGGFTNKGSDGTGNSVADIFACDADGTTVLYIRNGSTIITATGLSAYSTGVGGMNPYGAFTVDPLADDWSYEVAGGGGGTTYHNLCLLGVGG